MLEDVKQEVLHYLEQLYQNHSPEFISCSKPPVYRALYDIGEINCFDSSRSDYLQFEVAKDEVLSGKLTVETGCIVFYVEDKFGRIIEDAGRVCGGQEYKFSIKAEQSIEYYPGFPISNWVHRQALMVK